MTRHARQFPREHHADIRPELHAVYSVAARHAVRWVCSHVPGAERRIGRDDLEAEAWTLVWQHHDAWEREARNLAAYSGPRLRHLLANQARKILTASTEYGKTDGKFGPVAVVFSPGHDAMEYLTADRSRWWARTFRRAYPFAAEQFLALGDDERPVRMSAARWASHVQSERLRLRRRYAAEISDVDTMEQEHDETRLLDAMFGEAA
jgi:hypothetical protein